MLNMLRSEDGRRVLRHFFFKVAMIEEQVFQDGDDGITAARREGRRSTGRDMRRLVEAVDPKGFVVLMNEDIDEQAALALEAPSE